MKGVVFAGDRQVEIRELSRSRPRARRSRARDQGLGHVRQRPQVLPRGAGEAARRWASATAGPVIAGHEPCGVVVAVGPGVAEKQARVGMRVMQHHYRGCGVCPHCSTGWMQLCVDGVAEVYGVTGHGAHAPYMKCPARTLVPLPDDCRSRPGAAISCGTGTAWGALHRLGLTGRPDDRVFGQGPVGLSATQLAAAHGCPRHRARHQRGAARPGKGIRCRRR